MEPGPSEPKDGPVGSVAVEEFRECLQALGPERWLFFGATAIGMLFLFVNAAMLTANGGYKDSVAMIVGSTGLQTFAGGGFVVFLNGILKNFLRGR